MLLAQIKSIMGMGWEELRSYRKKLSMSNLDNKRKFLIEEKLEERAEELRKRDFAFVENGEVKTGELV